MVLIEKGEEGMVLSLNWEDNKVFKVGNFMMKTRVRIHISIFGLIVILGVETQVLTQSR